MLWSSLGPPYGGPLPSDGIVPKPRSYYTYFQYILEIDRGVARGRRGRPTPLSQPLDGRPRVPYILSLGYLTYVLLKFVHFYAN